MNKFQMTDAKSGLNLKNGKIDMSLYTTVYRNHDEDDINEVDLLLSLLGGYNKHGRKFDLEQFKELEKKFNEIIEQASYILKKETTEEREVREYAEDSQKGVLF